jgi:hypothetical protein
VTGAATDYTEDDVEELFNRLVDALSDFGGDDGQVKITADIEWAGEYNRKRHRTTTLAPMDLSGVREAVQNAVDAQAAGMLAGRRPPPKGVAAQVRALQRTKAGRSMWERAGLSVSPRTVARWLAGTQRPSKANRERLEQAALQQHYDKRSAARGRTAAAKRAAVDAFTEVVQEKYGSEIRFFNISDLDIE